MIETCTAIIAKEHSSFNVRTILTELIQAKENADELVAKKKEIDAQVVAKRAEAKELEAKMRQKASTAGNIVGKDVPVSMSEVRQNIVYRAACVNGWQ